MTSKALMLAAAVVLAACSRNPKPATDETGAADTTSLRPDTSVVTDTSMVRPDTAMAAPDTAMAPTDTTMAPDTSGWRDTSQVQPPIDTSGVQPDTTSVPYPKE